MLCFGAELKAELLLIWRVVSGTFYSSLDLGSWMATWSISDYFRLNYSSSIMSTGLCY